jgi:hypothetical protein
MGRFQFFWQSLKVPAAKEENFFYLAAFQPLVPFALGLYLPKNALFYVTREGAVPCKPSESGNNTHFQRHSCPGPDFRSEKSKNIGFSPKTLSGDGIFTTFSKIGMAPNPKNLSESFLMVTSIKYK